MLLKKLVAVVSAVVVIAVPYVKVLADDTVITLDETAKKFVVIDKNLEYRDMLPGEERSSVIKISNSTAVRHSLTSRFLMKMSGLHN